VAERLGSTYIPGLRSTAWVRKSRFTEEQIIGFIKQAEAGMPIKELCRKGGFSDAMFYKWRAGEMKRS
jgi:hypothetical protein